MKKVLFALLFVGSVPVFAQTLSASKVPEPAQTSFTKKFVGVKDVRWEKEDGNFEANFNEGGTKKSAVFNSKGEWMETESAIELKKMPPGIAEYIDKNYKGAKIKGTFRIEKATGTGVFEVEVGGKELTFGPNGQFVSDKANK